MAGGTVTTKRRGRELFGIHHVRQESDASGGHPEVDCVSDPCAGVGGDPSRGPETESAKDPPIRTDLTDRIVADRPDSECAQGSGGSRNIKICIEMVALDEVGWVLGQG